ncbi:hypothetical protein BMS3Bbin04_01267 [bacterium BMS3Bbin04]|nr:hypothetical protein BMS3Bbin04_01267 [bacterium BMS3Bbin04]
MLVHSGEIHETDVHQLHILGLDQFKYLLVLAHRGSLHKWVLESVMNYSQKDTKIG